MRRGLRRVFYGWYVLGALVVLQLLFTGVGSYCVGVFAPSLEAEYGLGRLESMAFGSFLLIVSALASPVIGHLLDGPRVKAVMLVSALAFCLGLVAFSLLGGLWSALFAVALIGISRYGAGALAGATVTARWFDRKRGVALGIAATGTSFGGLVMAPLAAALIENFGWRGAALGLAGILFTFGVPVILGVIVGSPERRGLFADGADAPPAHAVSGQAQVSTRVLLTDPRFWLLFVPLTTSQVAASGVLPNITPLATDQGIELVRAASLVSFLSVGGVLGKLAFGYLMDTRDPRVVFSLAMLSGAVGCVALMGMPGFAQLIFGSALIGVATGGLLPARGVMISRSLGSRVFGRVLGWMLPLALPILPFAAPFAGWIRDRTGNYDLALVLFGSMYLLAALTLVAGYRRILTGPVLGAED